MSWLFISSAAVSLITAIVLILSQIYLWQRKEYRWDRMRVGITSGELGNGVAGYVASGLVLLAGWLLHGDWLGLASMLLVSFELARRAAKKGIYRPVFTLKAGLCFVLVITAWLTIYVWVLVVNDDVAFRLAWLLLAVPLIVAGLIWPINIMSGWRKRQVIVRATNLRASLSSLKVIGVTGSYGKTTTKHFIGQLITEAMVTKEHRNSELVLAYDMLEQLSAKTRVYAAEMSAYAKGEIAFMAHMAAPQIGVVTNIGNQHLALFGSQTNILEAKWELVTALPPDGIAVLNADDELIRQKAASWPGRIVWFSLKKKADVYARDINITTLTMTFVLHIGQEMRATKVNLGSEAYLSSLVAAVAAVYAAGEKVAAIFDRVPLLKPYPRTMEVIQGKDGRIVIDDSYSANEKSVLNAVRHLGRFTGQDKRILLVPLIELGDQGNAVHGRIRQALLGAGAKVFVYGSAFHKELGFTVFNDPGIFANQSLANISEETVILLEGRVPNMVREKLGLK